MVRMVLVSATSFEIEPTLRFLKEFNRIDVSVKVCITGVGMVNTAFELGKLVNEKFDLAINAGIAGAFSRFAIGDLVNVMNDCFCELGAENDSEFINIDDLGFGHQKVNVVKPFESDLIKRIPKAWGVTVNTTHGNEASIKRLLKKYPVDVESMEGAAFIHAANSFGWKAIQLRAISNKVEKRNRDNWNIPLAIEHLNTTLIELIKNLNEY